MSLYFIITLPPEEKSSPVVFSHQNPPKPPTVLDCFCLWSICAYFSPDSDEMTSLEEAILWIEDLYFSQKQQFEVKSMLMDFLQTWKLFTSQDVN